MMTELCNNGSSVIRPHLVFVCQNSNSFMFFMATHIMDNIIYKFDVHNIFAAKPQPHSAQNVTNLHFSGIHTDFDSIFL